MTNRRHGLLQNVLGCTVLLLAACNISPNGNGSSGGAHGGQSSTNGGSGGSSTSAGGASAGGTSAGGTSGSGGQVGGSGGSSQSGGQTTTTTSSGGQAGKTTSGGRTGGTTGSGGSAGSQVVAATGGASSQTGGAAGGTGTGAGGQSAGSSGQAGQTGKGGQAAGATGQAGQTGKGGQAGGTGAGGAVTGSCVGKEWPTANPAAAGPFEVATDKNVGPLAGVVPDPVYGDQQQRFNVYRPKTLAQSGYCHPIVIWANGYTDNPEPNPPKCVLDSGANKWCGQYLPLMQHLASHGFVVVASLSTATAEGTPLPTIAGMDWIIQQAEDSSSQYYHRLDTSSIGQLGHSYGGMSTCMSAADPRYKALATICGTRALSGLHTPILFYCGGKDTTVKCDGVKQVFDTVKDQPAFFIDELASDHGWWVYQGASGVSLSMAAAWFRVHLMNDTANRKYFYGSGCTFCKDSRVQAAQNSLMAQ